MKKTFAARLEGLRGGRTQREFAEFLGIPLTTYTNWIIGKSMPRPSTVESICSKCGVSYDYLLGISADGSSDGSRPPGAVPLSGVKRIPVIGLAAAMHYDPSLCVAHDLFECAQETVPCVMDDSNGLFAVRIDGDSMSPTLVNGDVIAVREILPATGDLCLALHRTDGILCKRWYWKDGVIKLISDNHSNGKTYKWTKAEFTEENPLVWRWRIEALLYRKL